MAALDMAATMDALADALVPDVVTRAYPWPVENITVPCVVVGYPNSVELDYTMNRGSDRAVFPVYYIAGRASDRITRDELSRAIAGATGIKDAIDGDLDGAVSMARVVEMRVSEIVVNRIAYTALECDVEIIS